MSVLLSMLTLVPGHMGGSETYARELVGEMAQRDIDISALVAPVGAGFASGMPERIARQYPTGASTSQRVVALAGSVLRRRSLRAEMRGADVVHYPFTVRVPAPSRGQRNVISLLDVQHHDLPQLFSRPERIYRALTYDRYARAADAVITLSQFAKQRIVETLDIPPANIHVAHLGVRRDEFAPRLHGRATFLLYPAKGWPHKNHAVLFEAFRLLRQSQPDLELILTGATVDELPAVPHGVQVRGRVGRRDLVELYATAAALVFPSRYEGFGLPVLEAMSSGCPVAAASAGSLPEVVGDAGVLFDPDDASGLAHAVSETLDRADELQHRGLARARQFEWSACADVHEALYRRLGG